MRTRTTLFLMLLCAGLSSPALAEAPKTQNGHFIDSDGATLYTFDKDSDGKSACSANCAKNWPPALVGQDDVASGDWTFVESHDGKPQWAYKGKPLYRFAKDAKPGDTTGDGVGGVWHLAKP
jgi:predicted lipoprotein with Yx(FWY)xxD motif